MVKCPYNVKKDRFDKFVNFVLWLLIVVGLIVIVVMEKPELTKTISQMLGFSDDLPAFGSEGKESDIGGDKAKSALRKRTFSNIVEKQKYRDSLPKKYGEYVVNWGDMMELADAPLPVVEDWGGIEMEGEEGSLVTSDLYSDKEEFETAKKHGVWLDPKAQAVAQQYHDLKDLLTSGTIKGKQELGETNAQFDKVLGLMSSTKVKEFGYEKDTSGKSWWARIKDRKDVDDKLRLVVNLMSEGGNKIPGKKRFYPDMLSGYESYGLDRIAERTDEFIKRKFLPENFKERIELETTTNELGKKIVTARFKSFDDVITAHEAFLKSSRENAQKYANKLGVKLTKEGLDYFTFAGFLGEGGARSLMEYWDNNGMLRNEAFLKEKAQKWKQYDVAGKSRLARMKMMREEAGYQ